MNSELPWSKSSYSDDRGGDCIEVAPTTDTVHVRDSKDQAGPQLAFSAASWADFVSFAASHTAG
ncbi:hypothetical protein P3T37_004847 [Kitasatospora sp. MAA4]|uniref:DUF397 domain-containing protein n=1 Tax=Kitasatospora sp. MAA4 TaxID=3035093 RepID=UPI0024751A32|nr:DUF397 domain-containing protein [Kitasatospora sp. MAA4]MDH6135432.1 hypothetical protein [Kitasatospora sp. MAA4]